MMLKLWRLLDAAGDGTGGGAGAGSGQGQGDAGKAGAGGQGAGNGDAAGGAGDKAAGGKADPSLLSQGAGAGGAAAGTGGDAGKGGDSKLKADPLAWLPERFRVKGEGDAVNFEESGKKVAGAYAELEKRMKDTGLPPESADKYEFKPAKGMEALELDGERTAAAKKGLHALGLTQKQYQGVMEMYVGELNSIVERGTEMGAAKAREALTKVWGAADSAEFKGQLGLAHKAFMAFADDGDKALMDQIGNNPVVLKILAKVGRELREDQQVTGQILSGESLEQLMKDPAYFDVNAPRHAEVVGKVHRHFQAQQAAAERQAA